MDSKIICVVIFSIVSLHWAFGDLRETCTNYGRPIAFRNGTVFQSVKENGRTYRCICSGRDCQRFKCKRLSFAGVVPRRIQTGNDHIIGEPLDLSAHTEEPLVVSIRSDNPLPNIDQPPPDETNQSVFSPDSCKDEVSGQTFQRGTRFIRVVPGSVSLDCNCPYHGEPRIVCETVQCRLPEPPQRPEGAMGYSNCYDPWLNREVSPGIRYVRTRMMNERTGVTGDYSCVCENNVIRCSVLDIPCCDRKTAEFVGKQQWYLAVVNNQVRRCLCRGGTEAPLTCQDVAVRPPTRAKCQDKRTGEYHNLGSTWIQRRRDSTWKCRCLGASGNRLQTRCDLREILRHNRRH